LVGSRKKTAVYGFGIELKFFSHFNIPDAELFVD
jgi:hypothetical protein